MAEIGNCYGSEWQILRCLGHHRNKFNDGIGKALGIDAKSIEWLDYPIDGNRKSGDNEYKSIEIIKHLDFAKERQTEIMDQWNQFWATQGNAQRWDGVFTSNGVIHLVEAKGHIQEIKSSGCSSVDPHISNALSLTIEWLTGKKNDELIQIWKGKYYQLANRLAFAYFMSKICHIPTKVVYVYFLNAWQDQTLNIDKPEIWNEVINIEKRELQIIDSETIKSVLYDVVYDCDTQQIVKG